MGTIAYDTAPGHGEQNGTGYDRVGNRRSRTASTALQAVGVSQYVGRQFTANDHLVGVNYDLNGNTKDESLPAAIVSPSAVYPDEYDFKDRLIQRRNSTTSIVLKYDGDGNRVQKIITDNNTVPPTVTTVSYLVDDQNPTRYAQVLYEQTTVSQNEGVLSDSAIAYTYGHHLISEAINPLAPTFVFYGHDGHGSVRFLVTQDGTAITDTYTYDAFGILIDEWHAAAATPNHHLYAGEQFDPDLGLYYNRARYLNPNTGRFWSMDSHAGHKARPTSLHKYLYCSGDPINRIDPSGHQDAVQTLTIGGMAALIATGTYLSVSRAMESARGTMRPWMVAGRRYTPEPVEQPQPARVPIPPMPQNEEEDDDCPTLYISKTEDDMPAIAQHIEDAQRRGPFHARVRLHVGERTRAFRNANRDAVLNGKGSAGLDMNGERLEWDEYPFASTREGGDPKTVSLRAVHWRENRVQGGIVNTFYNANGFSGGECFYVRIID